MWLPLVAGLVNALGFFEPNTKTLLQAAYSSPSYFWDVTYGFCGPYEYYNATAGYDICTGLGTPKLSDAVSGALSLRGLRMAMPAQTTSRFEVDSSETDWTRRAIFLSLAGSSAGDPNFS